MRSRWRKILALSLLGVVALAALVWWRVPRPGAPPPLPNPNGYDDLLKGAALISKGAVDLSQATLEELEAYVEGDREALRLARVGLGRRCQVPVEYTQTWISAHTKELAGWRALAQALKAEGALAERKGRLADAVQSYLDAMRLGHQVARGGLLIDQLVGLACQAIGLTPLTALRTNLSAQDWRKVIRTLEAIEAEAEPVPAIFARELDWGQRTYGARYVALRIVERLTFRRLQQAFDKFQIKQQNMSARRRLLLTEAAVRCFWLENQRYPESLRELVPGLLKAVPADPYTELSLIYRPKTDSFQLYSTGPDGRDDRGKPVPRTSGAYPPAGDIFLDSPPP